MRYSFTIYFNTDRFEHGWKESFKSYRVMKVTLLKILDDTVKTVILEDKVNAHKRFFNKEEVITHLKDFNTI